MIGFINLFGIFLEFSFSFDFVIKFFSEVFVLIVFEIGLVIVVVIIVGKFGDGISGVYDIIVCSLVSSRVEWVVGLLVDIEVDLGKEIFGDVFVNEGVVDDWVVIVGVGLE